MDNMTDCLFCKIVNKSKDAEIVYEDDDFLVFNDIRPAAPKHLLLIPRKHIESINHLEKNDRDLMGDLFLLAKKIAKEQNVAEGYKLSFNVGRKSGQVIDHLHLHLMGGY